MGMKTTNNHLGSQAVPGPREPGLNSRMMPDPSNNLTLLNPQPNMGVQSQSPSGGSKLFYATQLESRDELDEKHDRCFKLVMGCVLGKSEKEAIDALTVLVAKDPRAHEDVCLGLVVTILTSPSISEGELSANRCFRDLNLICRDGLSFVLSHLTPYFGEIFEINASCEESNVMANPGNDSSLNHRYGLDRLESNEANCWG